MCYEETSMTHDYDLIVLGGGSGGLAMARRAAAHGARCALVEAGRLGGTCVNRGCVPKKIMWHAAEIARSMQLAPHYAFTASLEGLDWAQLKVSRDAYIKRLNHIYQTGLEDSRVELVKGSGRFLAPHVIEVEGRRLSAPHVGIATGGRPLVPPVPGARLGITSDGFFGLFTQPRRVAIVGSGYVAMELATTLRALGSDVSLLIRSACFLNGFDDMLRECLTEAMQEQGIDILSNTVVQGASRDSEGLLTLDVGGRTLSGYDCLIWAVGRVPNSDRLNLEAAGVLHDDDGWIRVDDYQNTNVPGIYAIGDVTGRAALTPVAIAAGRHLADRLFGGQPDSRLDYSLIPTVIFSHPPLASAGLSEDAARASHGDAVKVYQTRFVPLQYALSGRSGHSTMKLVTVGLEERVVGCHMAGPGVDEMLQGFVVAMGMGACKSDFDRALPIHPTGAEEMVTLR